MLVRPLACIAIVLLHLLAGCASVQAPLAPAPPSELFHDSAFAAPADAVGAADLFTLSPAMRAYLKSTEFTRLLRSEGLERGLVEALYRKGQLKLEYDAAQTRNAAQTFDARVGNCLSLVIMTAAFARELGLTVRYQNVQVDQSWSRMASLYVASTHVNLSLGRIGQREHLTIDFLPSGDAASLQSHPLAEDEVVAMYLNNRAAEALAQDRISDAYWWARAAVLQYPRAVNAYNTLGVIHRQHGDRARAARAFEAALQREPENTIVMHNLVPVLALLGRQDESRALAARLASLEPVAPFHYFNLGMKAMENSDFVQAKALFAREVRRAPYYHEFHFWLALAHLRLGETFAARAEIRLALDTSTTRDASALYSAKLEQLRSIAARAPAY
jgi:Tfp pilus assembly protein PilF